MTEEEILNPSYGEGESRTPAGGGDIGGSGGDVSNTTGQSFDYREAYKNSSSEALRLKQELEQERQQRQFLAGQVTQFQQTQQQFQQQQQQPRPAWGDDYLTPEERSIYQKAKAEIDIETVERIRDEKERRRVDAETTRKSQQLVAGLFGLAQQQQRLAPLEQELQSAPELQNESSRNAIVARAQQIRTDPAYSWTGGNQHLILREALQQHRIQHGVAAQRARTQANNGAHVDFSPGQGSGAASPESNQETDYRRLLTADEKVAATSAVAKNRYYGVKDDDTAMRRFWDSLTEADRKARIRAGRAPQKNYHEPVKL